MNVKYKVVRGIIDRAGVYGIKLDGIIRYVGSSGSCMEGRYSTHVSMLRQGIHSNKRLQELFDLHYDSFEFVVLEYCKPQSSLALEKHYMELNENTIVNEVKIKNTIKHIRSGEEKKEVSQMFRELNQGANNPNNTKLCEIDVKEILWLKANSKLTHQQIADRYDIAKGHVSKIGRTRWLHIQEQVRPYWFTFDSKLDSTYETTYDTTYETTLDTSYERA